MKNNDIRVNKITLIETPETDEALDLLQKARLKFDILVGIFSALLLLFALPTIYISIVDITNEAGKIPFLISIMSLVALTIVIIIQKVNLKPYHELLKLAKSNDKVRHEEKIRFREKTRLEEEYRKNNKLPTLPPRRPN